MTIFKQELWYIPEIVCTLMTNSPLYTIEFEVVTAVVMKSPIFSYITLCSPLKVNGRFGGM
jgi:hypothetical protein